MKEAVGDLEARRERALAMGGPEAIARQHAQGKVTARERIARLFDPASFQATGLLAGVSPEMAGRHTPADGVVTGSGAIAGRPATCVAHDFTVMAGSMGRTGEVARRDGGVTMGMPGRPGAP